MGQQGFAYLNRLAAHRAAGIDGKDYGAHFEPWLRSGRPVGLLFGSSGRFGVKLLELPVHIFSVEYRLVHQGVFSGKEAR